MPYADPDAYRACARESMRRRRAANPEADRAASRAYYARNKEARRAYRKQYVKDNPEKVRVTGRHQSSRRRALLRGVLDENVIHITVFERDGMTCQGCGITVDPAAPRFAAIKATLDHIIPLAKGGRHRYDNVQTLCWPCNHTKRDT